MPNKNNLDEALERVMRRSRINSRKARAYDLVRELVKNQINTADLADTMARLDKDINEK